MKKIIVSAGLSLLLLSALNLSSCKETPQNTANTENGKGIVVDVRTPEEWEQDGHADCAVNIPLDEFESRMEELRKYEQITVVCKAGGRAAQAEDMLKQAGFSQTIANAGSWQNVQCN